MSDAVHSVEREVVALRQALTLVRARAAVRLDPSKAAEFSPRLYAILDELHAVDGGVIERALAFHELIAQLARVAAFFEAGAARNPELAGVDLFDFAERMLATASIAFEPDGADA